MPFTFAHPAAAVPLLRPLGRYGSLSALVIGSIAPDLAFVVALGLAREQTHGLAALFLFCLPAGALLYVLFHALLKAPLLELLPDSVAAKMAGNDAARAQWSAVLVSLLCGAVSHLLWDAFTHPGTPVTDALPILQTELARIGGYRVLGYKVLQHASSVLGLSLLALWTVEWLRRTPAVRQPRSGTLSPRQRIAALLAVTGIPVLAGLLAGWRRAPAIADLLDLQDFATGFIFTALPAGAIALLVYSVLWQAKKMIAAR